MSKLKFLYRKAQSKDVSDIKHIETEGGLSPWSVIDYEQEIDENPNFIVCELEKKIVGFLLMRLITNYQHNHKINKLDINNKDIKGIEIEAEILNIGVLKNFQRNNIGASLLGIILEKIKACKKYSIMLDVRASNKSAIEFYKTFNFRIISRRKNLYTNPVEDGYFMKLEKN